MEAMEGGNSADTAKWAVVNGVSLVGLLASMADQVSPIVQFLAGASVITYNGVKVWKEFAKKKPRTRKKPSTDDDGNE